MTDLSHAPWQDFGELPSIDSGPEFIEGSHEGSQVAKGKQISGGFQGGMPPWSQGGGSYPAREGEAGSLNSIEASGCSPSELTQAMEKRNGKVYLIGAGPGDPDLLTLKGRRILEEADVVVYDFLANEEILKFCPCHAERVYVGKQGDCHTISQGQINDLLVRRARDGALVARLKGGDPYIFGRGGEEAEYLQEAGVAFEVVPGVSSAVAAPAYAGIPLTDRRCASSVAIVTGHEDPGKGGSRIRWEHLAHGADTLVFLMGVKNLDTIVKNLLSEGKDPLTPAAIIRWGTTPMQQAITAPLEMIVEETRHADLGPPAVLVVGDVVNLRSRLSWFESAPLFGRRILVTRSREQASVLSARLRDLGANPKELPTIQMLEPEDWDSVDQALEHLEEFNWIVFTSPNGVRYFLQRIDHNGRDIRDLKGIRIAAIGPSTAESLESRGVRVNVIPKEYRAESLAEALSAEDVSGKRFLLPRAQLAREILPERLRAMGAIVEVVAVYRTAIPKASPSQIKAMFVDRPLDAITFTSSSTVNNFVEMVGKEGMGALLDGVIVACIGPITGRTAEERGIKPHIVPKEYTIPGLVDALVKHFRKSP